VKWHRCQEVAPGNTGSPPKEAPEMGGDSPPRPPREKVDVVNTLFKLFWDSGDSTPDVSCPQCNELMRLRGTDWVCPACNVKL
jgi:hypothetical protein